MESQKIKDIEELQKIAKKIRKGIFGNRGRNNRRSI